MDEGTGFVSQPRICSPMGATKLSDIPIDDVTYLPVRSMVPTPEGGQRPTPWEGVDSEGSLDHKPGPGIGGARALNNRG